VLALPVLVSVNAVARYSGLFVLIWIDEVSVILFFWLSFLGAAIAVQHGAHFRFTALQTRLPKRVVRVLDLAKDVALLLLGVGLLVLGVSIVAAEAGQTTPVLSISFSLVYAPVPISGAFFVIYTLVNMLSTRSQVEARAGLDSTI
jgi:TRAP-type C4-dicarboxylate transport system permease small subunit